MAVASFVDVCRFLAASGGTGDFVVSAAVTGYQTPALAGAVNGATYHYRAESADLSQWEIGQGVYTVGSTTLARTTTLFSSTGGAKVSFTNPPQVAIVLLAEDLGALAVGQIPGTTTNDDAGAGDVGEYVALGYSISTATVTTPIASPGIVNWTTHGLAANTPVYFSGGVLPTGITANTNYYVIGSSITANTFQIATSVANAIAGTAINFTGTSSGTQTGTTGANLATTVTSVVAAIQLTAGDWDVFGQAYIAVPPTTNVTYFYASLSATTAADLTSGRWNGYNMQAGGQVGSALQVNPNAALGPSRFSLSATTTIYIVLNAAFTVSTNSAFGILRARRVR